MNKTCRRHLREYTIEQTTANLIKDYGCYCSLLEAAEASLDSSGMLDGNWERGATNARHAHSDRPPPREAHLTLMLP